MLALMRLLSPPLAITRGRVTFDGRDLTALPERGMRELRGSQMAMIYQDPMTSLNPLMRIGAQVAEAMTAHGVAKGEAQRRSWNSWPGRDPDPSAPRSLPHSFRAGCGNAVIAIPARIR